MRVLLAGGSGNIGKQIQLRLEEFDVDVYRLTRKPQGVRDYKWNPAIMEIKSEELLPMDAWINLTGSSIAEKWTPANQEEMFTSRIESCRLLIQTLKQLPTSQHPKVIVQASAIGIYNHDEEWQDESTLPKTGFLPELVQAWEEAISEIKTMGIRLVILRIGIVLDHQSGALKKLIPLYQKGLGAALGSGNQWMSWIDISDVARMFIHCLINEEIKGTFNAVSPNPVRNRDFSKSLAKRLRVLHWLPAVPSWILKLTMGKMATLLLISQKISSVKIQQTGFEFQFATLSESLKHHIE